MDIGFAIIFGMVCIMLCIGAAGLAFVLGGLVWMFITILCAGGSMFCSLLWLINQLSN